LKRKQVTPAPEEIPDAEHELAIDRVAAIDVAKAFSKVCVRTPRQDRRVSKVWAVEATTGAVSELAAQLAELGVEKVTIESTSDYWRIWYYTLTIRIDELLVAAEDVEENPTDETPVPGTDQSAVKRLTEIPGIGSSAAQIILAEIGLDMTQFPTAAHLVSWAKLCPRTIQSGPVTRGGKTGKGNPYLKGALGEAAAAAAKTDTFLGERYRRIVKRRGKLKALVAVARSILVIVWQLLSDPSARFHDLGSDYHATRTNIERRMRNHIAQLAAMGYRVTVEPAA
jgi:transposase